MANDELISSVLRDYGMAPALPIINNLGQFQVGGDLPAHIQVMDAISPISNFNRFKEAAQPVVEPNLMGGAEANIRDKYGVAMEGVGLLGLAPDVTDIARVGLRAARPALGRAAQTVTNLVDEAVQGSVKTPLSSQEGKITFLKRNDKELQTGGFDRTTTDMPYYDDLINKPDMADYFRDQKGLESRMVDITPDKYLETVDKSFTRGGVMDGIDTDKVSEYAKKMREGEQFPALTLDYAKGKKLSQEGRHRALAAKEAGIDSVPVLVVTPTQEEAEYLGVVVPRLDF
jgi:hypothetical protein